MSFALSEPITLRLRFTLAAARHPRKPTVSNSELHVWHMSLPHLQSCAVTAEAAVHGHQAWRLAT